MQYYEKFNLAMRVLHWLVALIVLGMLVVGYYMGTMDNANPNKWAVYDLHKSIGIIE